MLRNGDPLPGTAQVYEDPEEGSIGDVVGDTYHVVYLNENDCGDPIVKGVFEGELIH